jgi:dynactin-4
MATQSGPYVLNCTYCFWNSQEVGVTIDKPNSVYAQLSKTKNGGSRHISPRERRTMHSDKKDDPSEDAQSDDEALDPNDTLDAETHFANLKSFYQSQLLESSPSGALGFTGDYGYGSPGALSRIMGLYTGNSFVAQKTKSKPGAMREATEALEGLQIQRSSSTDAIAKLKVGGWEGTTSLAQQRAQMRDARFTDELRPVAMQLRTKRSKRCRTCRHILTKPESKVQNTRFRIRLVVLNYILRITIKALQPSTSALLTAMKPVQFLLTFKNPLFESVRVNIATPTKTPGRFGSKVTVLCPQFEVGANTDMWDEALREGDGKGEREKRRTKAEANEGQHQAEAGKVWERGRNWVSVVVEVVPASLRVDVPAFMKSKEQKGEEGPLREDEDVLEIPVFVRVEWEADAAETEGGGLAAVNKDKELREKRELAYWCVLGVGRIAQD